MTGEPWRILCKACGAILAEGVGPTPATEPCQICGSRERLVDFHLDPAGLSFSSRQIAHGRTEGEEHVGEAVRISGPRGRAASGDVLSDTSATQEISGPPAPQGEEGRLDTANLLVERLRELGQDWSQPYEVDFADIDCRADGDRGFLDIQVVRADKSDTWRTLSRTGRASKAASPAILADALLEVARKKARLPAAQLGNLLLAIDARDTPVFAMGGTIDSFRQRHLDQVARLGFRAVWVVGPTVALVARLDT
jgi:hypothetical protein